MTNFNFNFFLLSKQAKIDYNALYNVILAHSNEFDPVTELNQFTVPLCFDLKNKVALTEKNFIFFDNVLSELHLFGFYFIERFSGRAVEDVKTDYSTVKVVLSHNKEAIDKALTPLQSSPNFTTFDFSDVDTSKLLKRDGKEEKAKTKENKTKKEQEKKEAEKTSKELEEKTAEIETLKKEVAKKDEQLNKKAIAEFNDDALFTIADCIEVLIKKHCPIPSDFNFSSLEKDLFTVINSHWDLKVLDK